jgi:beta-phosphoglucomutase-like phosphatase (HAD superfamily)
MRAIVFDFNGTLSDDEALFARIYEELFAELGRPVSEDEYFEQLAGHTDEEILLRWFGRSDEAWIAERVARYKARAGDGSTVDAETRAAVRYAAARAPVAVVSSGTLAEIEPVLEAAEIRDAISVIVSRDDVARGKPDPECYVRSAELLGIAPHEQLVFEDTDVGVAAAKAAGAYVVGVTGTLGAERLLAADELAARIDVALLECLLSGLPAQRPQAGLRPPAT